MIFALPKRLLLAVIGSALIMGNSGAQTVKVQQRPPLEVRYFDAEPNVPALRRLLTKAAADNLARSDHWLRLLHFEKRRFGRWQSRIDDPNFFLSVNGKTDADEELRATLTGFFSSQRLLPDGRTAQCKFPARYYWLNQQLNFAAAGLTPQHCPRFKHYMNRLQPDGITVVFAASHPGGPASMFGHTLLRIDQKNQTDAEKMLAWSISYAADGAAHSRNPLAYAVSGLAGGYPGRFSLAPYYVKMRAYGQMEDRALWEYQLRLSTEQAEMIARHSYELRSTWSDYYFLTENCAYLLLALIDVALPGARVSRLMKRWVLPADSLVALQHAGLVESVTRQPSYNQIICARRQSLSTAERHLALQLAASDSQVSQLEQLPSERQAAVLDLAYDYRRYARIRDSGQLTADVQPAEQALLSRRAKLGGRSTQPPLPAASRPDQGHGSQRIELGAGQFGGLNFISLGWRAAYHDVLDPQAGYRPNSRLEVLNLQARLYSKLNAEQNSRRLKLHKLDIIDILAIEPRDDFFQRWSWNARAGLRNSRFGNDIRSVFTSSGGAGQSYALTTNGRWLGYAMFDGELDYTTVLPSHYRITVGPRLGLIGRLTAASRLHLEARHLWRIAGAKQDNWSLDLGVAGPLTDTINLKLNIAREHRFGQRSDQFMLLVQRYY